jgi:glycosyltransferase involved in cell wall biosynthesis
MSKGLPVVVSRVGGLVEAVEGYAGAVLVPPANPGELRDALLHVHTLRGRTFADPHSWQRSVERYTELFEAMRLVGHLNAAPTALVGAGERIGS